MQREVAGQRSPHQNLQQLDPNAIFAPKNLRQQSMSNTIAKLISDVNAVVDTVVDVDNPRDDGTPAVQPAFDDTSPEHLISSPRSPPSAG